MARSSKLGLKDEINLLLQQVQLEASKMAAIAQRVKVPWEVDGNWPPKTFEGE